MYEAVILNTHFHICFDILSLSSCSLHDYSIYSKISFTIFHTKNIYMGYLGYFPAPSPKNKEKSTWQKVLYFSKNENFLYFRREYPKPENQYNQSCKTFLYFFQSSLYISDDCWSSSKIKNSDIPEWLWINRKIKKYILQDDFWLSIKNSHNTEWLLILPAEQNF